MVKKPSYEDLEQRINQLQSEILNHVRKEVEFEKKQKLIEYSHIRRTISLMKINEELNIEINRIKSAVDQQLNIASDKLKESINKLNCLYNISKVRASTTFSLDDILQTIVDFIPPAIQCPGIICARIRFAHYEFTTKNFKDTKWRLSQEIKVNNESIGDLEVFFLEEEPELEGSQFFYETKKLIKAIADNVGQIVEREWAEMEIRKGRIKIEALIKGENVA
jgi:hypothetical protein